jgi:hypothetical protein
VDRVVVHSNDLVGLKQHVELANDGARPGSKHENPFNARCSQEKHRQPKQIPDTTGYDPAGIKLAVENPISVKALAGTCHPYLVENTFLTMRPEKRHRLFSNSKSNYVECFEQSEYY